MSEEKPKTIQISRPEVVALVHQYRAGQSIKGKWSESAAQLIQAGAAALAKRKIDRHRP